MQDHPVTQLCREQSPHAVMHRGISYMVDLGRQYALASPHESDVPFPLWQVYRRPPLVLNGHRPKHSANVLAVADQRTRKEYRSQALSADLHPGVSFHGTLQHGTVLQYELL